MAFCRFCGKQIPEGGACDCATSKAKEAAANEAASAQQSAETAVEDVKETVTEVKEEAVQAAEAAQEAVNEATAQSTASAEAPHVNTADTAKIADAPVSGASDNVQVSAKNSKNAIYVAACIIALVVLMLLMCLFGGGAKSAVKNYVKSASNKKGGKTYYSYTLPKDVIKKLKKKDKYDDLVDHFNDMVEEALDDLEGKETAPKFMKIVTKTKLNDSELEAAEDYFKRICDKYDVKSSNIKVTKGYEMKLKTKNKDEDGDVEYHKSMICVVKLKGDGWKIIPQSKESLD
jgi:hypothetical protein